MSNIKQTEAYHWAEARPDQAKEIGALHALSWQRHYRGVLPDSYLDEEVVSERISVWSERFAERDPSLHVITLSFGGELIGFSGFFVDQHPALGTYIDNLHVLSEHQGRGLGLQLMQKTAQQVLALGKINKMYLHVFEQNEAAAGFYRKVGGKFVGKQMMSCPGDVERLVVDYAWDNLPEFVKM